MIIKISSVFNYLLVLGIILSQPKDLMMFWLLLEVNLITFIMLLFVFKTISMKHESPSLLLYYFIIQSSTSMLLLSSFLLHGWLSPFNQSFLISFSLLFKSGFLPVYFWVYKIGSSLGPFPLTLLLTFQKIPLFCLIYYVDKDFIYPFIFGSLLYGAILLFNSKTGTHLMISSSISYSFVLFVSLTYSIYLFFVFLIVYMIFTYYILLHLHEKPWLLDFSVFTIMVFCFFMGLPPLSIFFLKFVLCAPILSHFGWVEMIYFWISIFISLIGYIKYFHYSFFFFGVLYPLSKAKSFLISLILTTHIFFLL